MADFGQKFERKTYIDPYGDHVRKVAAGYEEEEARLQALLPEVEAFGKEAAKRLRLSYMKVHRDWARGDSPGPRSIGPKPPKRAFWIVFWLAGAGTAGRKVRCPPLLADCKVSGKLSLGWWVEVEENDLRRRLAMPEVRAASEPSHPVPAAPKVPDAVPPAPTAPASAATQEFSRPATAADIQSLLNKWGRK